MTPKKGIYEAILHAAIEHADLQILVMRDTKKQTLYSAERFSPILPELRPFEGSPIRLWHLQRLYELGVDIKEQANGKRFQWEPPSS